MAMSELHHRILVALMTIGGTGPKDECLGICGNVVQIIDSPYLLDDEVDEILIELFSDWPDKSHSTAYPIGKWSLVPSSLFWHFHDARRSMWDRKTTYGTARWALLEHCINKLSQGEE